MAQPFTRSGRRADSGKSSCVLCASSGFGPFAGGDEKAVRLLDEGRAECVYPRGQILFQEGNPAHSVFCIKKGLVKLLRHGRAGAEHIVAVAGPGDLVGHAGHITGRPLDHGAVAATEIEVCQIGAAPYRRALEEDPKLLSAAVAEQDRELAELRLRWIERSEGTVPERLFRLLGKFPRGQGPKGRTVTVPLSRQELASYLGTAPETVMRALRRLADDGFIDNRGREIRLLKEPPGSEEEHG